MDDGKRRKKGDSGGERSRENRMKTKRGKEERRRKGER